MSSVAKGRPKHQNKTAWKANAGVKKKEKELGGKLHPYPEISGVCPRCKAKIEWRRKYGKYKALVEPTKCNQCSKRAVRQAYHALCSACARERNICAKCCQPSETIIGKDADKEKEQQQQLEQMSNGMPKDELQNHPLSAKGKSKVEEDGSEEDWGSECSEDDCDLSDGDEDVVQGENKVEEFAAENCGVRNLAIS